MGTPAISICIPAFNAAPWIGATVESVLAQSRHDFELLVLDDASQDETLSLVRRYRDPRIRVLAHDTNKGAAATWNHLLREAAGQYVKLLCCDDLLYPSCLERQAAIFDAPGNQAVTMVCSPRDIIDETGRVIFRRRGLTKPGRFSGRSLIRQIVASGRNMIGEPLTVLFRRNVALAAGGFDATHPYCIDVDMWCRLLSQGDLVVAPEVAGAFRVSPTAWSTRLARQQASQDRAFFSRIRDQLDPTIPRWMMWMGQARCTIDATLRQAIYAWLRLHRSQATGTREIQR